MPRQTNFKKEIEQPILSVRGSACKTDPTIIFSYTFAYALASTFTNTPSTHSSFQGTGRALAHADALKRCGKVVKKGKKISSY